MAFVLGLPAISVVAGAAMVLVVVVSFLEKRQISFYKDRVAYFSNLESADAKEFSVDCAKKLVSIKPIDEHQYMLGGALDGNKQFNEALNVMRSIAPDDKPRYSDAHRWIADSALIRQEWSIDDEQRKQIARVHFGHVLALETDESSLGGSYAATRLANLLVLEERYDEAIASLKSILDRPVTSRFQLDAISKLLQIYRTTDRIDELKSTSALMEPKLYQLANNFPDAIEPWVALIDLAAQAGDYEQAEIYIREALTVTKSQQTRELILQVQSALLLRRASLITDLSTQSSYLQRYGLLAKAMAVEPRVEANYLAMMEFVDDDQQQPLEDEWLRLALPKSGTPGITHVILGIREMLRGNLELAANHWNIANKQYEGTPLAINNFIRVMIRSKSVSNETLLKMATQAFNQFPDHQFLRISIGETYQDMGRLDDAVKELELAVGEIPNFIDAREALRKAYLAANRNSDAEIQIAEIAKIRAKIAETQPDPANRN
jgi:tetratricopeptide (TPR) repeat protein